MTSHAKSMEDIAIANKNWDKLQDNATKVLNINKLTKLYIYSYYFY